MIHHFKLINMKFKIQYNEPFTTKVKEMEIEVKSDLTLPDGQMIDLKCLYEIKKSKVKGQFYLVIIDPHMEKIATDAFFAFLLQRKELNNFENFKNEKLTNTI
jgi:hypothetical protein